MSEEQSGSKIPIAIAFGAGLLCLLWAHSPGGLGKDLLRDLGIAFVVSGVVASVIEVGAARRKEAEIRAGVLSAIMERIVPSQVWEEIKSTVIHPAVLCKSWRLTVSISKRLVTVQDGKPAEERYVASGTLTYDVENLLNRAQPVYLMHELESTIAGKDGEGELPEFQKVQYDFDPKTKDQFDGAELRKNRMWVDNLMTVRTKPLAARATGHVEVTRREILQIPFPYTWYMKRVTDGLFLTIQSDCDDIEFQVIPRHPTESKLIPQPSGHEWAFAGVMLPGQGLEVRCLKKRQPDAAGGS